MSECVQVVPTIILSENMSPQRVTLNMLHVRPRFVADQQVLLPVAAKGIRVRSCSVLVQDGIWQMALKIIDYHYLSL